MSVFSGWRHVFKKDFHENLRILQSDDHPEKKTPSNFGAMWRHTKHLVKT